jgi:hypothetical protein
MFQFDDALRRTSKRRLQRSVVARSPDMSAKPERLKLACKLINQTVSSRNELFVLTASDAVLDAPPSVGQRVVAARVCLLGDRGGVACNRHGPANNSVELTTAI